MTQPIIIIGAGAAGLAAGRTLHDLGLPVLILEARDRIGGRVWTSYDLAPYPVELGAEFIHGTKVLTWEWLKWYGLGTVSTGSYRQIFAGVDGKIKRIMSVLNRDWEETIWEAAEEWLDDDNPDISLRDLMHKQGLLTDPNTEEARLVSNMISGDYGGNLDEIGAEAFLEASFDGDGSDEGDFRLEAGYTKFMHHIADGLDIRLNTPVQQIRYSSDGVHITTADGNILNASAAIVTLPLGVLKVGDVKFDPVLPPDKQKAITLIGAGAVNKVILTFKEPFWQDDMHMIYTALDSQMWWRPGWGRWEGNPVLRWAGLGERNEKPLLTAFAGGKDAAQQSTMSEDEAVTRSLKHLQSVFGRDVTDLLVSGQFVNWGADPYSKMGYSFGTVGSAGMREVLAAPLDNRLYFAGEACNPIRPQTVHGAMETGIQAAQQIHAIHNNKT